MVAVVPPPLLPAILLPSSCYHHPARTARNKKNRCPFYVSIYTGAAIQGRRMWTAHTHKLFCYVSLSLRGAWVSAPVRGLSSRAWPAALARRGPRSFVYVSFFFVALLMTGRVVVDNPA